MPSIRLITPVPGPNGQALLARRVESVPRAPFNASPVFVARAEGATVTDVDGNTFLDFAGGLGALSVGHNHPDVVEAIQRQASRFVHTCFHVAMYEPYVELAERLNRLAPGSFPKQTLLVNSGAEAVENAVKIARYATGRSGVVAFEHGFAGRTLLALSLTSKVMPYKKGFGPFAPEVYRLPYPYYYRSPFFREPRRRRYTDLRGLSEGGPSPDTDYEAFVDAAIAQLHEFFHTQVDPESVACVCMELVLGEGGFVVAPRRYVVELAAFCRRHGILLVADEIQTGFGRTGTVFVAEQFGIEPDLVTMAKSLSAGLPLAAVTGRKSLMEQVHVGGLGGTFGGNPVACAGALAALEVMKRLDLPARAVALGLQTHERLEDWRDRCPRIGDVRGVGAMLAIELVKDRATREPDKEFTGALIRRCAEKGLLLMSAGTHGNVVRLLFPLVIDPDQLDEGLDVLEVELMAG